jgi:hypothetical protein
MAAKRFGERGARMQALLMMLVGVFSLAVGASALGAQDDLERYYQISPVSLPDSLSESYAGGSFRLTVLRTADSERDRRLLRRAESFFPPHESIEADVADFLRSSGGRGWTARMDEAASLAGSRWWWDTFDGILTPYALTGPTVAYYIERLRDLAAGPSPVAEFTGSAIHRGEMRYRAGVRCQDEGARCVVDMRLEWRYRCGSACAIWFTEERAVTFDASGEIVSVEGDGRPSYEVS